MLAQFCTNTFTCILKVHAILAEPTQNMYVFFLFDVLILLIVFIVERFGVLPAAGLCSVGPFLSTSELLLRL